MEKELRMLIEETKELEKMFHSVSISSMSDESTVKYIFDVPQFVEWITKVKYELNELYSRTNDKFIFELINANGIVNRFDGKHHDEYRMFIQLMTSLKQILNNAIKYYPAEVETARAVPSTIYLDFFKQLLLSDNVVSFIDLLYSGELEYSEDDLNEIFGYLKDEGLIKGRFLDNRFYLSGFTFKGKHLFDTLSTVEQKENTMSITNNHSKPHKIFISHNTKDKKYVELLVNLLTLIGLKSENIFCSSLPGYDIPVGENIFDYLRDNFLEYNLHVIFIHSENYYKSAVSLNEMGAAWALKSEHTSMLLPDFEFSQMQGVINGNEIGIKLDNDEYEVKDKLSQLKTKLVKEFDLDEPNSSIWEKHRDDFINAVISHHASCNTSEAKIFKRPF